MARAFLLGPVLVVVGLIVLARHGGLAGGITMLTIGVVVSATFGALAWVGATRDKARRFGTTEALAEEGFLVTRQDDGTFWVHLADPDSQAVIVPRFAHGVTEEEAVQRARQLRHDSQ